MSREWIEVDWIDNNDTVRTLQKVKAKIQDDIDRILLNAVLILESYVKAQIKEERLIDTGYLRANWTAFIEEKIFGKVGVLATNTEYAPYLEEGVKNEDGSTRIKAYKFARKAWTKAKPHITSYINREFTKLVEKTYYGSGVTPYA